jgi:hypothetical protein
VKPVTSSSAIDARLPLVADALGAIERAGARRRGDAHAIADRRLPGGGRHAAHRTAPRHRSCRQRPAGGTPAATRAAGSATERTRTDDEDRRRTTTTRATALATTHTTPDTAMSSEPRQSFEDDQRDLNPHRDEERQHATDVIESQLRRRGIRVTGDESSDDAADILSAVERFEAAVSALGGDRYLDDPRAKDPDDKRFVIPERQGDERAADYARRILDAAMRLGVST